MPSSETNQRDKEVIVWILDFLQRDFAAMLPGELFDLKNEVFPHLHEAQKATVDGFEDPDMRALLPAPIAEFDEILEQARGLLEGIQGVLQAGMTELEAGRMWFPFSHDEEGPRWILEPAPDGTISKSYKGKWRTITIATASEALARWWPNIRRCKDESCRVWFLPRHGKQRYHNPACSARVRRAKYEPGRKRDLKAEYQARTLREANRSRREKI